MKQIRLEGTSVWLEDQRLWDFGDTASTPLDHTLVARVFTGASRFPDMKSAQQFHRLTIPFMLTLSGCPEMSTMYATMWKLGFRRDPDADCERHGATLEKLANAYVDTSTRVEFRESDGLLWIGEVSFGEEESTAMLLGLTLLRLAGAPTEALECVEDYRSR